MFAKVQPKSKLLVLQKTIESEIIENQEELEPINYFIILLKLIKENELDLMPELLQLLLMVLPNVEKTAVRKMDVELFVALFIVEELHRSLIDCIKYWFIAQDYSTLCSSNDLLRKFLFYITDARPKIRKKACEAIIAITASCSLPAKSHPLTSPVLEYCHLVISSSSDSNKSLYTLVFLKDFALVCSKQSQNDTVRISLVKLFKLLLSLPMKSSGNNILTGWVFQVLDAFTSDGKSRIEQSVLQTLVKHLVPICPHANDTSLMPHWLHLMSNLFSQLSQICLDYENQVLDFVDETEKSFLTNGYSTLLLSFFKKMYMSFFDTTVEIKPEILDKVTILFSVLFSACVTNLMVNQAISNADADLNVMLGLVKDALGDIKFQEKWSYLLIISCSIFEVILSKKATWLGTEFDLSNLGQH